MSLRAWAWFLSSACKVKELHPASTVSSRDSWACSWALASSQLCRKDWTSAVLSSSWPFSSFSSWIRSHLQPRNETHINSKSVPTGRFWLLADFKLKSKILWASSVSLVELDDFFMMLSRLRCLCSCLICTWWKHSSVWPGSLAVYCVGSWPARPPSWWCHPTGHAHLPAQSGSSGTGSQRQNKKLTFDF